MAMPWTPPEPSHYERAEGVLSYLRDEHEVPKLDTHLGVYFTVLATTLGGAIVHSLLAIADAVTDVEVQLGSVAREQ